MLPANTEKCLFDYYYKSPRPPSKDLSYFKIFYYIIQFGCVYLCMRVRASVHMWRSEGSLREVVLSYHVLLELSVHQAWQCMPSLTKPCQRNSLHSFKSLQKQRNTNTKPPCLWFNFLSTISSCFPNDMVTKYLRFFLSLQCVRLQVTFLS